MCFGWKKFWKQKLWKWKLPKNYLCCPEITMRGCIGQRDGQTDGCRKGLRISVIHCVAPFVRTMFVKTFVVCFYQRRYFVCSWQILFGSHQCNRCYDWRLWHHSFWHSRPQPWWPFWHLPIWLCGACEWILSVSIGINHHWLIVKISKIFFTVFTLFPTSRVLLLDVNLCKVGSCHFF